MGESAERMARRNEIAREAQDEFARALAPARGRAIAAGRFDARWCRLPCRRQRRLGAQAVHADTLVRADTSVEKLASLRPAFAKDGTITAGNASPLTDGAAAVLLMSEEGARARLTAARARALAGRTSASIRRTSC